MGGLAFANTATSNGKPPQVPRMSPQLYQQVAKECQTKLEKVFDRVVIPREPPGKADHGDIDFLVEGGPARAGKGDVWATVKTILGAELHLSNGGSHSYAIPHLESPGTYVQVDVELSPGYGTPEGPDLFEWTRFIKGDADLVQLIGVSHRPLGLTCNDQGLHLIVEEIAIYNKKKSLLFLTRDPDRLMEFYGFDATKYWAGFSEETEIFDWVSSGRFFSSEIFENRTEKSNDRSRQKKRPMYRRFVEEYMPLHPGQGEKSPWTREQVISEALEHFNKKTEYEAMMEEHRNKEIEEKLWSGIRATIPAEGNSLGIALKGLRHWVVFQNGKPAVASEPVEYQSWTKSISIENKDAVLRWVLEHWEQVKRLEKSRGSAARQAATTG
ncbi:hypothetical protein IQ07DRAFT_144093 [Pyrenochaeta sp. DS3sAY3a]|nr:hypothetical protein IQ07DRAFT_144093 [Pyrenochaeta sp. DS3sAY3a]